ncbi:nucleotidyltransferase family protein [Thalassolituus oleivorans]|uniref:nucleotidyltransferase family protein n=1 Tax=Thalassolituus oleivorans TaxID=187493 RepID=UPI0023F0684A|nr:nucleotidyltransferase family protein [Thalassolituus oleivorans]
MGIGIVILAAGRSERFGQDKRCLPLNNKDSVLLATIRAAKASGLSCYVVLHPGDHELMHQCQQDGVEAGICPDARLGIGHSIAFGVRANQHWQGWIIARGNMPWVQPVTYQQLAASLFDHPCIRPVDGDGHPGFPTAFRREFGWNLMQLHGHRTEVRLMPSCSDIDLIVNDPAISRVIRTPKDLCPLHQITNDTQPPVFSQAAI